MSFTNFRYSRAAGYVFIILGILNWSGNFIAARGLADIIDASTVNLYRWILASLIFLPFGFKHLWRERKAALQMMPQLIALGLCGVSLYDCCIFWAGHTTQALNMTLISTLSPMVTSVVAHYVLKEYLDTKTSIGILISAFGVVLLVTKGDLARLTTLTFTRGDLFILITVFLSAAYNIIVKQVAEKMSQNAILMTTCIIGALGLVPISMFENGGSIPPVPEFSVQVWGTIAFLAVFASILCYLFWNLAIEILGASLTTMFMYTLPPVSAVTAWLVLGETVVSSQIISGLVIFSGIGLALFNPGKLKRLASQDA